MLLLKRKRVKRPQQPGWIDNDILDVIKTEPHFTAKKDNHNYTILRHTMKLMIFHYKQEVFNLAINSNDHNPKRLWASMNELRS